MAGQDEHSPGGVSGAIRPGALSALLQEIAAAPASAGEAWDSGLRPGAVVGRFELVRELGRGGFGVVWEARDRELGRRVAFKAVRAGARRDLREERLLREAEAAAQLSHPNIVTLHDVGRSASGPYLVLELLDGKTLAERLSEGTVPAAEAVRTALEVAKGLAHAHAHGVVHRDLKPENVFLCRDGQVKVLDFGLSHAFGQRRVDGGTPAYMAPEQAKGAPEDERTDVFALGAMLFEMLSGRRPFEDEKALRSPRPAPELEVPEAPGLGDLVARMLAKEPVERPRDGGEVLAGLSALQRELQRVPASTSGPVRARRRAGRRRAALIAAGVATVAAIAAVAWWRGRGPSAVPDGRIVVAMADVVNETGERELDVLSGLLVTSLEQSRRLSVMTQARVLDLAIRAGRKDAARVDETLGREVGKAHGVRALLLPAIRRLGTTYSLEMRAIDPGRDEHLFTLSDRATSKEGLLDLLDRLSERTRTALGEGHGEVTKARVQLSESVTRSLEAYQHYVAGLDAALRDGHRAAALKELQEAIRLDPNFAAAHSDLAFLYHAYGRSDLAAPHWRAAEKSVDRMPAKERSVLRLRQLSPARHLFTTPSAETWSRDDALRLAGEVVRRFPDDKHALVDAADAYDTFELSERRDAALRRALDLDPGFWVAAAELSRRLGDRTGEALEVAQRAVATRRSAVNLTLLAEALHASGASGEAEATAREALKVDGGRNSLVVERSCFTLYQSGRDEECVPIWKRIAAEGQNALERDAASARLVEDLFVRGRVREGLRAMRSLGEPRPWAPGRLTFMLLVGHSRADAHLALEQARMIPNPVSRRNFLSALGATGEAERIDAALRDKRAYWAEAEAFYRATRAAGEGRYGEAADLMQDVHAKIRQQNRPGELFTQVSLLAEWLLAAGRPEEAAQVWPATPACRCRDPIDYAAFYPPLSIFRARALERLGRRADAVRELDGVIAFWKEADDDLPLLVEARAMRKRLAKAPASTKATNATSAPAPSIAVLPFADLSPGKDQTYFADGVAEEILNALSGVEGLKVIGRTSSFSFKGKKDDLRSIGQKLGASTVLEGSVRRDGARIRVTARLLRSEDGHRVWSETYERELGGVFAVQDEIAKAVVESLKVSLAPAGGPALRAGRTGSPEAHNQYLLGLYFARQGSRDGFRRAEEAFRRAIALDPGYALAHVGLASALVGRYNAGDSESAAETERMQKQSLAAAERAVQLAPDLADAYQARGMTRRRFRWDWPAAREDLDRALALDRNNSEALWNHGFQLAMLGRLPEGIASLERATQVEPLSVEAWRWLGFVSMAAGERARARKALLQALEIAPEHDWALVFLSMDLLAQGRAASALETMDRSRTEGWKLWGRALAHHSLGNAAESRRALDALIPIWAHVGTYQIAEVHAWRGEKDQAFEWLERCYRDRDSGLLLARFDPLLRDLRGDGRYRDLMRRMKLPED